MNFRYSASYFFFHVISDSKSCEMQQRICPLDVPFLLPTYAKSGANFDDADSKKLSFPFQRRNLPLSLFQHFLIGAAGPMSLLNTWLQPRSLI